MTGKRRCVNSDEAPRSRGQHTTPCGDCPWARNSLKGWLGGATIDEWLRAAGSDEKIMCHAIIGPQCAGAAIFRRHICKSSRDPRVIRLPADTKNVFSSREEFTKHHDINGKEKRKK